MFSSFADDGPILNAQGIFDAFVLEDSCPELSEDNSFDAAEAFLGIVFPLAGKYFEVFACLWVIGGIEDQSFRMTLKDEEGEVWVGADSDNGVFFWGAESEELKEFEELAFCFGWGELDLLCSEETIGEVVGGTGI